MARKHRARFVALVRLLEEQHPHLEDPTRGVVDGLVVVDGRTVTNPRARVRKDASVRVVARRELRGRVRLARALDAFRVGLAGAVAVDVGAAAGGFTAALLERGAARVLRRRCRLRATRRGAARR